MSYMVEISEDLPLKSAGILAKFLFFPGCMDKTLVCLDLLCLWLLSSVLESAGCFASASEHPRESKFHSLLLPAVVVVALASGPSEHLSSACFLGKHTRLSSYSLNTLLSSIFPTSCCVILQSAEHCQLPQGFIWTTTSS